MSPHRVKMVLAGAGNVGRRHLLAARRCHGIDVVGCMDVDAARAGELAGEFGIRPLTSIAEISASEQAAFVDICTPPGTHEALAVASMQSGFHVLVEKPCVTSMPQLKAVEECSRQYGRTVGVISQHRFAAAAMRLRRNVAEGRIGTVESVQIRIRRCRHMERTKGDWRNIRAMSGGGILMTIAVHQLDLACTLVDGDLHEVQARVIDSRNGMDDHMVGRCMIADTKLSVDAKWGQVAECPDTLTVVGSERRLTLEGDRLREVDEMEVVDRYELHARQLCDFAQAISSGGRPEVALSDARKTLSIIFAMYHAAGIPQDEQVL